MEKQKNNCWECPCRGAVAGSAHISCDLIASPKNFEVAFEIAKGRIPKIENTETGEVYIEFHPTGIKNGWCTWPLNFDPVWVTCRFPIDEQQKQQ